MRIGTLFSGIGAPEQAALRVWGNDAELVFACEWDKFARQSFKAIYDIENEHFHVDINDLDGKQYAGKVDCIIGGSPCQDFSIAGLRAGVDGHRGQLIWQYFRIIDEVRPPVFIYENVKGMISDKNGKTIQDFLEVFRSIGYFCHWEVLNSKDYGVPQNRERVFIVGFLDHEAYYRFQFAPAIPLEKRLKDVLQENVDEKYYLNDRFIETSLAHKERHEERGNGFAFEPKTEDDICGCLQTRYGTRQTDTFIKEPKIIIDGMIESRGENGIIHNRNGINKCLKATEYKAPSLLSCTNRIRKLTPLECWRLQDFPDEAHEKAKAAGVSDSQLYKQAGNSITVAVMEMILRQIDKTLKGEHCAGQGCLF